jgi:peptidoglycan/LPS O-acetylase OafA/YrhL
MLTNVQGLRALAAFLVVFVHLEALAARLGLGADAFAFGNAGVDVFFVISGMIMVLTTSRRPVGAGEFLRNRIARIVPFYWLVTAVVFALALAEPALFQGTRADPGALARSLLFVPFQRQDGVTAPVVFVGWTLNYEMAFYGLFALGLMLRDRRLGLVVTLAVLACAAGAGWAMQPAGALMRFYSAPIILEFGLGMLIGVAAGRIRAEAALRPAVLVLGGGALVVMLCGPVLWPGADRLFAFGLPAAVVVASAVYLEKAGWALTWPLATRLGDASFATYLTHFFVTQAAVKAIEAAGVQDRAALVLAILAVFPLVAAAGVAVHLAAERPLSRALKRALTPRAAAPAAQPGAPAPRSAAAPPAGSARDLAV